MTTTARMADGSRAAAKFAAYFVRSGQRVTGRYPTWGEDLEERSEQWIRLLAGASATFAFRVTLENLAVQSDLFGMSVHPGPYGRQLRRRIRELAKDFRAARDIYYWRGSISIEIGILSTIIRNAYDKDVSDIRLEFESATDMKGEPSDLSLLKIWYRAKEEWDTVGALPPELAESIRRATLRIREAGYESYFEDDWQFEPLPIELDILPESKKCLRIAIRRKAI